MTDRVNQYYQLPVSAEMVRHFREDIGLAGDYLAIFNDLRAVLGDTQLHADNVGLPVKRYNDKSAIVGQKCLWELLRLAEIGLKASAENKD